MKIRIAGLVLGLFVGMSGVSFATNVRFNLCPFADTIEFAVQEVDGKLQLHAHWIGALDGELVYQLMGAGTAIFEGVRGEPGARVEAGVHFANRSEFFGDNRTCTFMADVDLASQQGTWEAECIGETEPWRLNESSVGQPLLFVPFACDEATSLMVHIAVEGRGLAGAHR